MAIQSRFIRETILLAVSITSFDWLANPKIRLRNNYFTFKSSQIEDPIDLPSLWANRYM